jgi:holliday junction DNA helicase RuvA
MIAYIKGKLVYKSPTDVIVEANGIGYRIHITLNTYRQIVNATEVQLLTHYLVKEDGHSLYGFSEGDELSMFENLISVSGVGPNTARVMLSAMSPKDIRAAIIAENENILKSAKGIGIKSAKRIIVELKDKLLKDSGAVSEAIAGSMLMSENPIREEAISALVTLGFLRPQVQKVLNAILKENPNVADSGELIRMALGQLSS